MTLAYLLHCGGSAYLPQRMVRQELAAGQIHIVAGAPVIERHAYAVYPLRSGKSRLIQEAETRQHPRSLSTRQSRERSPF